MNSRLCPPTRAGGTVAGEGVQVGRAGPGWSKPWELVRAAGGVGQVSKWRPRRTAGQVRPGSREARGHGGRTLHAHEAGVTTDSACTGSTSFVRAGGSLTPMPGPGPGKGGPRLPGRGKRGAGAGAGAERQEGPHAAPPSGPPSLSAQHLLPLAPFLASPGGLPWAARPLASPAPTPSRGHLPSCPAADPGEATGLSLPAVSRTFHSLPSFIPRSKALYVLGVPFDGQGD